MLNDLERIRNRAREQVRNNPWISRGIKSWEADRVRHHTQIRHGDEEFRKGADQLLNRQIKYMDANGVYDFNGMLRLIVCTRSEQARA